jgi:hypothetical protein
VEVREGAGKSWRSVIPSCHLVSSGATLAFHLHTDPDSQIYHVDMGVNLPDNQSACVLGEPVVEPFNSSVSVIAMIEGPSPKLELRRSDTSDPLGKQEDERTFLQKYWMYLLIGSLVLFVR